MIDKSKLEAANDMVVYGLTKENAPEAVKEAYDRCWNTILYKYIKDPISPSYKVPLKNVALFLGKNNLRKLLYLLVDDGVEYEGTSVLKDSLFIRKEDIEDFVRIKYDKGESSLILTKKRK